jgi:hypothetical protein
VGAAIVRLTQNGDAVSSRMSHEAATTWMRCPRLKTMSASHSLRNVVTLREAIDDGSTVLITPRFGPGGL